MKHLTYFALVIFCLGMAACEKSSPTSPTPPAKNLPVINNFSANPAEIHYRESSTLTWDVSNATQVQIDQGIGVVSNTGSKQLALMETTTYNIVATNADGQTTGSCTITVKKGAWFEIIEKHRGYTSYDCCVVNGVVQNTGDGTGYNVGIDYYAYNSSNTIIDTAHGFPADLGDIPPGVKATFEAVFFNLTDWDRVDYLSYEISWLNEEGQINKQIIIIR